MINEDADVRVKVTETKEVVSTVSVSDLRRRIVQMDTEIEAMKVRRDLVVDQIQEINDDKGIALTISDIPTKLITISEVLTK